MQEINEKFRDKRSELYMRVADHVADLPPPQFGRGNALAAVLVANIVVIAARHVGSRVGRITEMALARSPYRLCAEGRRIVGSLDRMITEPHFWESLGHRGWAHSGQPNAPKYSSLDSTLQANLGVSQLGFAKTIKALTVNEARPGTLSAHFGLGAQPLHTDCANWPVPPRYLVLYGIRVQSSNVETQVFGPDWDALLPSDNPLLHRVWTFQAAGFRGFYGTVFCKGTASPSIRYDPTVMSPRDLAAEAGDLIVTCGKLDSFYICDGNWLIIDNWRCLHARGRIEASESVREVERTYWG